jgi:hypothetical protein
MQSAGAMSLNGCYAIALCQVRAAPPRTSDLGRKGRGRCRQDPTPLPTPSPPGPCRVEVGLAQPLFFSGSGRCQAGAVAPGGWPPHSLESLGPSRSLGVWPRNVNLGVFGKAGAEAADRC